MLSAMYGGTTGERGKLLPSLARAYPRAVGLVEAAARAGERGEVVTTRLGRSSPAGVAAAYDESVSVAELGRARASARSWGRFTRNFVVQGSAGNGRCAGWPVCADA